MNDGISHADGVAAVCAQLGALPDAEVSRFVSYLARRNVEAVELPLAQFLADLAIRAEREGR